MHDLKARLEDSCCSRLCLALTSQDTLSNELKGADRGVDCMFCFLSKYLPSSTLLSIRDQRQYYYRGFHTAYSLPLVCFISDLF